MVQTSPIPVASAWCLRLVALWLEAFHVLMGSQTHCFSLPCSYCLWQWSLCRGRNKTKKRLEGGRRVMGDERSRASHRARSAPLRLCVNVFVHLQISGSHWRTENKGVLVSTTWHIIHGQEVRQIYLVLSKPQWSYFHLYYSRSLNNMSFMCTSPLPNGYFSVVNTIVLPPLWLVEPTVLEDRL